MDTPLGRIGTATSAAGIMGLSKSVTYVHPLPSQLDSIGGGYWNEGTNYYAKFCSFLLNEV